MFINCPIIVLLQVCFVQSLVCCNLTGLKCVMHALSAELRCGKETSVDVKNSTLLLTSNLVFLISFQDVVDNIIINANFEASQNYRSNKVVI